MHVMATKPRISIVTPSFNQAAYLEKTLGAIIEQNYASVEHIVIDGGSVDGSVEILHRYDDALAYWVSEPDGGQSDAINKGFAVCTGDIITFCNSDDFYLPGTFEDVAAAYCDHPDAGAIVGGFVYVDKKEQRTSTVRWPRLDVETPYDLTLGPPGVYRLHQAACFFTRKALDEVGRYVRTDLNYVMDRELLYRVARQFPIVLRHKPYAAFRLHDDSKSVSQIYPFYQEFARLYLEGMTGNATDDRLRRSMARRFLAKGCLKMGGALESRSERAKMLLQALRHDPRLVTQRGYYARWRRAL